MWSGAVFTPWRSKLWNHWPRSSTRARICSAVKRSTDWLMAHLLARGWMGGHAGEEAERLPVAVERPHVDARHAGPHRDGAPAAPEVLVDERTDVLVLEVSLLPEPLQLRQHLHRRLEGAPHPARGRLRALHLHVEHLAGLVGNHGVEELRRAHREEQEGE